MAVQEAYDSRGREAWLLGDIPAVKKAFPRAKDGLLHAYINDSICGTWEHLADTVFKGGRQALIKEGWQSIGREKSIWAEKNHASYGY